MEQTYLEQDSSFISNVITDYFKVSSIDTSYTTRKELAMKKYRANKISELKKSLHKELADDVLYTNSEYQFQIKNRIEMVDLMDSMNVDFETIEFSAYSLITDEELIGYYDFKPEVILYDSVALKRHNGHYTNKMTTKHYKQRLASLILN